MAFMNHLRQLLRSQYARKNLGIIILATIMLQVVLLAQHFYTHHMLERELERRAESELTMKAILIKGMLNDVNHMASNHEWDIKRNLSQPDSAFEALVRMVKYNPNIVSVGLAFTPNYYPQIKDSLYEPYALHEGNNIITKQIANAGHNYTKMDFYTKALNSDTGIWSDPYVDTVGIDKLICTYSVPIHDSNGKLAAVCGIDVSLDWLRDTINIHHAHPSSFNLLLTESGREIVKLRADHIKSRDAELVIKLINDSTVRRDSSMSRRSQVIEFKSLVDGDEGYVYYANMRGKPHWQIVVVGYDNEVYGNLFWLTLNMLLFMLAAIALMGYIISKYIRNERKLHKAGIERERIDSELRIAHDIQNAMLPTAASTRNAHAFIDITGSLVPAKEVGGDIYDYFIRDEKLHFCIGDVSGKGVPSALLMAVTQSLFNAESEHVNHPAHIMQAINHSICHNNKRNMFVTFFIGILDLPTGRLRYCNAGHDAPVIINGDVQMLPVKPNLPLGVLPDFKYEMQEFIVQPGSAIFLYTDGLTEAMNQQHEQYGSKRMLNTLTRCRQQHDITSSHLLDEANAGVQSFTEGAEQSDDLTMLAIRYTPQDFGDVLHENIVLQNDVKQIPQLNQFVEMVTHRLEFEPSLVQQMKLAVEEAVVNVMQYAFPHGTQGTVKIEAKANEECLRFIISDKGTPFDPTAATEADTTLSVEERPIGGLGIFLVRKMMDSINYEHIEGKNILTLRKYYNKQQ